jgi:hypothetical protein
MTAIEWLIEQMFKQGYFDGNKPLTYTNLDHLQQQAKEMEKQQITDAWKNRNEDVIKSDGKTSEQYYQETFGSKGSDEHIVDINEMISSQTEILDSTTTDQIDGIIFEQPFDDKIKLWKLIDKLVLENQQTEISDEEIEKGAINFCIKNVDEEAMAWHDIFVTSAKWYRDQLKQL